jgi:CBS domain containing-hemolysin-like protein
MLVLFITVFFTLTGSFICSTLEAIILSVTHTYIEMGVQRKKAYAFRLQTLKNDIDRPLAAILTINTVSHTLGSVIIGAQVISLWGDYYIAAASVCLTLVILIFCEIIPKTLGASRWKALAPLAAYIISGLILVSFPIVKLAEWIADAMGAGPIHKITRE